MRTVTITKTYYTFNELSPEQQKLAIDKYWNINISDVEWWQSIENKWREQLENVFGFTFKTVFWSFDEMMFFIHFDDVDLFNKKLFMTALGCDVTQHEAQMILNNEEELCLYNYFESCAIHTTVEPGIIDGTNVRKMFDEKVISPFIVDLRKEHKYLLSEDAIRDTLSLDTYEFDEECNILN